MTTFATANARLGIQPYWWVRIEGLQYRYSTLRSGVDSIHDAMVDMESWLAGPPSIGGQVVDPLNGRCSIPSHAFTLFDKSDAITAIVAVSDTPWYKTYLTAPVTSSEATVPCEDNSDFPSTGTIYLDRETITYQGKGSDSDTDTASAGLVGQTADGGDKKNLYDAARTEADHYWAGAVLTVTGGANNGEVRTIRDSYWDVDAPGAPAAYLFFESPMPSNMAAADTYSITFPPLSIKTTTLAGADDYWRGAVVEVTAGTNLGESRWVRKWDLSEDLLELVSPMPEPCDGTTQFSITLKTFTSVTRGRWESDAVEHLLLDENGAVMRRPISDKVPFVKTRKVWIYESRIGAQSAYALVSVGVIKDYVLSNNHTSYTFQCAGLLELLSKKLMGTQLVGKISRKPLWGGRFQAHQATRTTTYAPGGRPLNSTTPVWYFAFAMDDGSTEGFSVNYINISSLDLFPAGGGHIKIDDELIYYDSRGLRGIDEDLIGTLEIGDTDVKVGLSGGALVKDEKDAAVLAYLHNRGLFSEKAGAKAIIHEISMSERAQSLVGDLGYEPPIPFEVKAFLQEHAVGAEIKQVCACYDSRKSDFPRFDQIKYTMIGGAFVVGKTITGSVSGWTAIVMHDDTTNDVLTIAWMDEEWSRFVTTDVIDDGAGATASMDEFRKEIRPRNNAIDVFLQLVLSTGTVGANGMYDTLTDGFGLGLDEGLFDVSSIETMRDKYFASLLVEFCLHEPTSAQEFFEKHLFRPLQVFPFETTGGKISLSFLSTYQEATAAHAASALGSMGGDEMVATPLPDWTSGKPPIGKVSVRYNKHPTKNKYLGPPTEIIFGQVREWYGDLGQNVRIDMPTLYHAEGDIRRVRHQDPLIPALLRRMIGVVWDRHAQYPCPVLSVQASYHTVTINVGDLVLVTESNLPNMRTSTRGLTDEFFQVIGRTPNVEAGMMNFTLWQVGVHDNKYARRAPSMVVASFIQNVGPNYGRVTVHPSKFSKAGTKDLESFSVGDEVMFLAADYDSISSPIETYPIDTIDLANNRFTIDGIVTTNPASGYFVEYADYDNCTSGQQLARTFQADPDHVIGSSDASAFKYL